MNSHWREEIINNNKSHNIKKVMNPIFLRISHRIRTQQGSSIKITRLECHKINKISVQEMCSRTYHNKISHNMSLILNRILTINNHQKPSDTSTNLNCHQHTKMQWCINLMICQG
jgi:hypothetical protein